VFDQRGTGAGALDCKALQRQMGSSDLTPPTAKAVRACARQVGARRQFFGTDDVVADMDDLRQALGVDKWALDGISYGMYVGERYGLAYPSHVSKLVLDSVVPQVGETDLGVAEFAAMKRVLRDVCGKGCVSDLAAVVRRYHLGTQLLAALTFDSIADPTFTAAWNVPAALHAAGKGNRKPLNRFLADAAAYQRDTPPPPSTRASTRVRSAPTGGIRGAARPRRSPAAPGSSEPPSRGFRPRGSIRSTPGRPRATGSSGSACRGRRSRVASSSCRRSWSTAPTISRRRSPGPASSSP
jgi:pimeloyl-ACP methyl ester carboxylesterase